MSTKMIFTLNQKIKLLKKTKQMIENKKIVFDSNKSNFGFKNLKQLFPVSHDEIKGFPCIAFNDEKDQIKFGVKVIPMDNEHEIDHHPVNIEIKLMKEFNIGLVSEATPHVTMFFDDLLLPNNCKALVDFPLKTVKNFIHRKTHVLISEYVPAGSLSEWIKTDNPSDEQWRYVVFSMLWTLVVLQDKYKFLHNDFHYGNILIDNTISKSKRYKYSLTKKDGSTLDFYIDGCGILPKIWDFEFSKICNSSIPECNENTFFDKDDDRIPYEFTPFHDIHYFLTSLLDLEIPESLKSLITKYYPKELQRPEGLSSSSSSSSSSKSSKSSSSKSSKSSSSSKSSVDSDCFYKTNESMETTQKAEDDSMNKIVCNELSEILCDKFGFKDKTKLSYYFDKDGPVLYIHDKSKNETEFMIDDRLKIGIEQKISLPTPLDLLSDPYFDKYKKARKTDIEFKYQIF